MNAIKSVKWSIALLFFVVTGISNVWADHWRGHARIGVVVGPYWSPYYYPPPYPSYPPVVIERAPPVYIEQSVPSSAPAPEAAQTNYWYYCSASKAYYPYVNECPSGWQKILPQPPR